MNDGELERRYEDLRRAAAAVLAATAADAAPVYPAHQDRVDALRLALDGSGPRNATSREVVDPDRHHLSIWDYQSEVPGGAPFPFADHERSIRRSLAREVVTEPRDEDWPDNRKPTLTELQAMVVATLLQELAARLTATGDPGGADLAAVVLELADDVLAPTFAGAQR
jgi:hypothetical protein